MQFVTRRAEMQKRLSDGQWQRDVWKESARKGNAQAKAKLRWPRYPKSLEYLDALHMRLSAGRSEGQHGIAPLTWRDVESWARQTDERLRPHEVEALVAIDNAFRYALRPDNP